MKTIKKITQLLDEQQEKVSAMIETQGVIFAFSKEQFEENRKEGVVYVNFGRGMLVPRTNIERIKQESDRLHREAQEEFRQWVPMNDYILYELNNYEVFYTGDTSEILETVQMYYPECAIEHIKAVYSNGRKFHNKSD